ncbi:major facilitator superfamily domain-containing protein [Gymnopilus junonius]|uniref:Major facilitator superfamily domain-containing protein n=1 Tax=Gymnopilus junonius TaxID=109634 RepID=A0A9P5NR41_GYMJU|nr:major facilitator superfamily domain-containing protein [Gymnopilus junonius]
MANNAPIPPPLLSAPRLTTLVASLFVALSAGTNYVYSAYSPQLGARLGITHTQLNIVGLAGNVGVYASGPVWGRIIDRRGPRIPLVGAFILLLGGYSGIRYLYDSGVPNGAITISTLTFGALVAFGCMTGAGGNAGLVSAVNSTAKTFPDKARGSTTGLVISGFGLSAFFFSSLSHLFFAGDTSAFLLVLALGTAIPMIMGFFLIRPIPLPPQEGYDIVEEEVEDDLEVAGPFISHNTSHTHLLDHDFVDPHHPHYARHVQAHSPHGGNEDGSYARHVSEHELEVQQQEENEGFLDVSQRPRSLSRGRAMVLGTVPNVYGKRLWLSSDFWLLFTILSILSGTGLMFINNVGSMSQALYAHQNPIYSEVDAATWQAAQVSVISLVNFCGRIFIGLVSDYAKNKYEMPRSFSLVPVSFFFFISQAVASIIGRIENLWVASALLGLAHGSVFSLFPTVCLEWFGMPHFSENWGYLSMSPIIAGNLFSLIFGHNLDAHDGSEPATGATVITAPQCLQGLECYVNTIYLTTAATFLAMLLSIWAGLRDRRKIAASRRMMKISTRTEAAWEDDRE